MLCMILLSDLEYIKCGLVLYVYMYVPFPLSPLSLFPPPLPSLFPPPLPSPLSPSSTTPTATRMPKRYVYTNWTIIHTHVTATRSPLVLSTTSKHCHHVSNKHAWCHVYMHVCKKLWRGGGRFVTVDTILLRVVLCSYVRSLYQW